MCGFVVVVNERPRPERDICESIHHRGPDSCGHVTVGQGDWSVDLHFRRLAVVDLDHRSDQPFGDIARGHLVYNGEIYNADAVRQELRRRRVRFTTSGDTEVFFQIMLQPDWPDLLGSLDGMFAFAFVSPKGEIRYGRDRVGIKPLYEATGADGHLRALSSEISPLQDGGFLGSVDATEVAAAAMFLWVPPPGTGWSRCRQVTPGMVVTRQPADFTATTRVHIGTSTERMSSINEAVRESLARQVQADVPVALLLSGGLDSTWLAHELARARRDLPLLSARNAPGETWSAEPFTEDAPFAERVAQGLGRDLSWIELDSGLIRRIPEMARVMEQPFGDPAALSLMSLSTAASEEATVLLSGVGVEELFLGYERYQAIKALSRVRAGGPVLRRLLSLVPLSRRLRERAVKFERMLEATPADWLWVSQSYFGPDTWRQLFPSVPLDAVVATHRRAGDAALAGGASLLEAAAQVDSELFLPGLNLMYADRASMHASIELRVPFLGEPVRSAAAAFTSEQHVGLGDGKRQFRAAAAAAGVPAFVLHRSKTGFGAPVRTILRRHGLTIWAGISDCEIFDDLIDRRAAGALFEAHVSGQQELGLPLFGLCSLAAWWEQNVSRRGGAADFLAQASF